MGGSGSRFESTEWTLVFDGDSALESVATVLEMIGTWTDSDVLTTELPLLNRTIPELFPFAGEVQKFFEAILDGGTPENGVVFDAVVRGAIDAANLDAPHVKRLVR